MDPSKCGKRPAEVSPDIKMLLQSVPQVSEDFEVTEKIGEGTFSKVFKGHLRGANKEFALKYIIPTSLPSRIESELKCLLQAGGQSNVMEVSTYLMNKGHFVIVMPYFPHDRFSDYVKTMQVEDARRYMHNLFLSLERIHSLGIIHRDIKPSNFLFNHKLQRYALVDFGLAQREEDIQKSIQADLLKRGSRLSTMRAQAKMAQMVRKRSLSNSNCENDVQRKRLCVKGTPAVVRNQGELGARALQPLSNRMNVTVHPVGSQSICKPSVPFLKEVLWTANGNKKLSPLPVTSHSQEVCRCFGKNTVCTYCLGRTTEVAPRAGTPGFRAPEVLLKIKAQTTGIDVWSAGIVFLSVLSGRYPFFKATDDLTALAEIVTLLGTERMQETAEKLGKKLTTTLIKPPLDLNTLCQKLRHSGASCISNVVFPDSAYDLLDKLLDPDPNSRITVKDALKHNFFKT